jgi:sugar phosphate isomerase/epimerase
VTDLARLSLNQATVRPLTLAQTLSLCARHEIPAVGLWRESVAAAGLANAAVAIRRRGMHVSSLCRGGFFTHADPAARRAALDDNLAAIEEARVLAADVLVLVSGGLVPGTRDLGLARRMIADAIAELVPRAQELGVLLGVESLHPMFCADRCVLSRLGDAVDLALTFPADAVGVIVDTYNVWWDSGAGADIARAAGRIAGYQLADWVVPLPRDMLLGRGHIGDGSVDFALISEQVLAAGYDGFTEVEIFSQQVWDAPPDETAATVKERFAALPGRPAPAAGDSVGKVSAVPGDRARGRWRRRQRQEREQR